MRAKPMGVLYLFPPSPFTQMRPRNPRLPIASHQFYPIFPKGECRLEENRVMRSALFALTRGGGGHMVSAWPAQIIYIIFLFRGEGNWTVTSISYYFRSS